MTPTPALLSAAGVHTPAPWIAPLTTACAANGITTRQRLIGFLSNIVQETGGLTAFAESLDYSPDRLAVVFPNRFTLTERMAWGRTGIHPANQRAIANRVYGGRFGNRPNTDDGWIFRGHGGAQTTFRGNFAVLAHEIGWTRPLEELPDWMTTPEGASTSGAVFWRTNGCNEMMDRGDMRAARLKCAGSGIGLVDVLARYDRVMAACPETEAVRAPQPTGSARLSPDAAERAATNALNDAALARARKI